MSQRACDDRIGAFLAGGRMPLSHDPPVSRSIGASASAGWSSQAARRAHNPEVSGSNPLPASVDWGRVWPWFDLCERFSNDRHCDQKGRIQVESLIVSIARYLAAGDRKIAGGF